MSDIKILFPGSIAERSWEQKTNGGYGDFKTCCFCTHSDLRNRKHIFQECEMVWKTDFEKFAKKLGYTGPPICYCESSRKYPVCPKNLTVCGHNIHCPNNHHNKICHIDGLLPERTMICNNNLDWEYNFSCNETCAPSFKTENGTIRCENVGNRIACNFTCNDGYEAQRTTNLTCAEAKNTACLLRNPSSNSEVWIVAAAVLGSLLLIIIAIFWAYKFFFSPQPSNSNNGGERVIPSRENGYTQNGYIPSAIIVPAVNYTPQDPDSTHIPPGHGSNHTPEGHGSNHTPEGHGSNHTPEGHGSNHTPEGHGSNHTPEGHGSNHTPEGHGSNHTPNGGSFSTLEVRGYNHTLEESQSLLYRDLVSIGYPDEPESLQYRDPGPDNDDVQSETPPKSLIDEESRIPVGIPESGDRLDDLPFSIEEKGF